MAHKFRQSSSTAQVQDQSDKPFACARRAETLATLEFDRNRKSMSTIAYKAGGGNVLFVKVHFLS